MTTTTSLYKTPQGEQTAMALYDAALAQWPVPYDTRCLPTRHGDTFVIASGAVDAPPLVLLHGAGGNSATWGGDVAAFSERFRVYAVDLPGEAGRSASNRPDWNGPAFAEWLADVLAALDVERATLAGISQGGWTALKYATAHPDRVDRLVLIAPGGIVPDRRLFLVRAIGAMMLGERGIRRLVRALFADQPVPAGVEDTVVTLTAVFQPRVGVLPQFTDDELRRLTMPVLLIGGTRDIIRDHAAIAARLSALLPRVSVETVQGAGHALLNSSRYAMPFLTA